MGGPPFAFSVLPEQSREVQEVQLQIEGGRCRSDTGDRPLDQHGTGSEVESRALVSLSGRGLLADDPLSRVITNGSPL